MRNRLNAALLVLAAIAAAGARAHAAGGAEPFDFLFLDGGARAVGMGGAYTALASDSEALLYNPAALGRGKRFETTFMHNQYINPITQEYVGFASPKGWGAQLNYLSFGRVGRTTISSPDGTGSSFGISDLALGGGYGRELAPGIRAGAAGKLIRETIDNVSAQGYALDLGGLMTVPGERRWTFGATLQNLGPTVKFQHAKESLPWQLRLGAACEVKAMGAPTSLALDLLKERSEGALISLGAESWITPSLAARVGYSGRNDAGVGISAGFGLRRKDFQFDYAMTPLGELGSAHRLSATVRWGGLYASAARHAASTATAVVGPRHVPEGGFDAADEFIRLEMWPQAEKHLATDAAVSLPADDPRHVRRLQRLGEVLRRQGKVPEAKAAYTEALSFAIRLGITDRYAADAYAGMGRVLAAEGNKDLAIKFFEKALEAGAAPDMRPAVEAELRKLRAP